MMSKIVGISVKLWILRIEIAKIRLNMDIFSQIQLSFTVNLAKISGKF